MGFAHPPPAGEQTISPTPDAARLPASFRIQAEEVTVIAGDTLAQFARRFGISVRVIAEANNLTNPNLLEIGTKLTIPAPQPEGVGSDLKSSPIRNWCIGPATSDFDIDEFVPDFIKDI